MERSRPAAAISDVDAFRDLSAANREQLARGLRYLDYAKGAAVLRKGERVSGAFVVISGHLRVFTLSADGQEATLYAINAHETCVLALNCIFNDLLYPAWVESGAPTRVAIIPGSLFRTLFDSEAAIRDMTVQAFSTLVFRLMGELEEIHSSTLEQRLAHFLLMRAASDRTVQLTQQEIASHLGTTREVIARALSQLAARGQIQTSRRRIVIIDPVRLADEVGGVHRKRTARRRR